MHGLHRLLELRYFFTHYSGNSGSALLFESFAFASTCFFIRGVTEGIESLSYR